ncbi:unnamed protein product [Chilo suppressalis]|uniref:RRM domain-containing protein n=1 Tax=Chilo suppressalis TaxID=168631 RepID=A0ABN8L6J6_CHISP|nr:unnamed protein product [Chilo suppressalis]
MKHIAVTIKFLNANTMSDRSLHTLPGIKRKTDVECFDSSDSSSDSMEVSMRKSPDMPLVEKEIPRDNLYGLKPAFLKSLGINPPIDQWVHITNFRCDKWELKEVLELAGHVVICSVVPIRERYARAMYSHPLEAVQAVSMLNGQTFFGQKLKINMVLCPTDTVIMPKGLTNVGPGLGVRGKPLRNIVDHYKQFINKEESLVDPILFSKFENGNSQSGYDRKQKEENNDLTKRTMSFKVRSVESWDDLEESAPPTKKAKINSDNSSPQSNHDSVDSNNKGTNKTETNDKSADFIPLKSPNVQPDRPTRRNLTVIPLESSSPSARPATSSEPGLQARPVSGPPGFNTSPSTQPGVINPRMNVRAMGTPNFTMHPGMALPGPQGVRMGHTGPQGMTMNPMGPARVPGPAPMNMNIRPGGYGPPNTMQPHAFVPPGMGAVPIQGPPAPSTISLQFRNLPPSTTFPLLCEKVSLCGQVLSLQLTTPGCAVAQFSQRAHAERCFQVFNGLLIDGYTVEVRYI